MAFVFILAAVIDIGAHIVEELQRACSIIQLLAAHGNRTAHKQLQEIERMCCNLSIPLAPVHEYGSLHTMSIPPPQNQAPPLTHPPPPEPSGPTEPTQHQPPPPPTLHSSHDPPAVEPQSPASAAHHAVEHPQALIAPNQVSSSGGGGSHHHQQQQHAAAHHPLAEPSEPTYLTTYLTDDLFLAQENDIYSWYHDLDLRGDDSADWEALGRELL